MLDTEQELNTPDPTRFEVSQKVLLTDSVMNGFIRMGGVAIIAAIFGILVFILVQVLPLFQGAKVKEDFTLSTGIQDAAFIGIDEWGELPFTATMEGKFSFFRIDDELKSSTKVTPTQTLQAAFSEDETFTSWYYEPIQQLAIFGSDKGTYRIVTIDYKPHFDEDGNRRVEVQLETSEPFSIGTEGAPIEQINLYQKPGERIVAVVQKTTEGNQVHISRFKAKRSIFGQPEELKHSKDYDLTDEISGNPLGVLVNGLGRGFLEYDDKGTIHFFTREGSSITKEQDLIPFEDGIANIQWLHGKISAVVTSQSGQVDLMSMYMDHEAGCLRYQPIQSMRNIGGSQTLFAASQRNRAFLHGNEKNVYLDYATTGDNRWETSLPYSPVSAVIGSKYDRLVLATSEGDLHFYYLNDPHPEASFKTYFGKIWYESHEQPEFKWESTGSSSDYEPKLSMVPLIYGSLKGTFYALLFAVPIAVLSAIYTSQYLHPDIAKVIKPTMEIMASLPSVVLGFLAALWLAPILETRVPSVLLALFMVPSVAILFGYFWSRQPYRIRNKIPEGREFWFMIPLLILGAVIGWHLGPVLERSVFSVMDEGTGSHIADFRRWWFEATGMSFDQRNSLIVGFAMGFAVIPIIFTISEDALSNVPTDLRSASFALGASRWQTAWKVVLPTASAGIFSAIIIGLGRAVGETMIFVMATGNTAIMNPNPFSGMRSLAANIAVELPEAAQHSTLYRSLFLGALLLFIFTFFINTIAEVIRQRLREKYKTVG